MDVALLVGTAGLVCLLAAFALEEFTRHTYRETVLYNCLNLLGGLALFWYALALQSLPFIALNAVWAVFAGAKLLVLVWHKNGFAGI